VTALLTELTAEELCPALRHPVLSSAAFLNEISSRYPEAVSLAAGRPYDGFFDPGELEEHLLTYRRHLTGDRGLPRGEVVRRLFQYGRTAGQIHELIAELLANDEGVHVPPESVVVVDGAQEGMFITLRALCHDPGDVLLTTSPAYVGILGAARLLGIRTVGVPEDEDGLDPAAVADAARRLRRQGSNPRALYVVPDFSNPSGHTLSTARRRELLQVADEEGLLILEDSPYGFLADQPLPSLKALDTTARVIHIGSFAKTCFPGARVGYVVADQAVRHADGSRSLLADQLALVRSMITVNTSSVAQAVIGGMLLRSGCRLREYNAERVRFYRDNLRTLLDALDRGLPAEVRTPLGISWSTPNGGFFVVVQVPFPADERLLTVSARDYGVLWTPMSYFFADGGGTHAMRLSCSSAGGAVLEEGARRLTRLVVDTAQMRR
jgi:(S)-3,5-dihydroxyphenylglycine transaminase